MTNILRRPLDPAKIEVIRRHFPHGVFGRDKEGFPVVCMRQGKMDAEAIKAVCSAEDMEHFWVQQNEYFVRTAPRRARLPALPALLTRAVWLYVPCRRRRSYCPA